MKNSDKYKGCLLGGAAGDALGYAVEFMSIGMIFDRYGENGITQYRLSDGKALISDDTQMTLFTANALISGSDNYIENIYENYLDWLETQLPQKNGKKRTSWLMDIKELHNLRAPGNTCLSALASGVMGTIEKPVNDSKGCGGIMRVAPIGLFFDETFSDNEVDMIAARAAAVTHGHELGYIPAAMLVHIIRLVLHNDNITLADAVRDSVLAMKRLFPDARNLDALLNLIQKAVELSECNTDDLHALCQLGEGWVAEETLAVAVYCALKYQNDFDSAIIAAVNHSGDSDSTGAVCGNILGAYLGLESIPHKYLENLELKDVIEKMAVKLMAGQ